MEYVYVVEESSAPGKPFTLVAVFVTAEEATKIKNDCMEEGDTKVTYRVRKCLVHKGQ